MTLSDDDRAYLRRIEVENFTGHGPRLEDDAQRRRLKRLGLIVSRYSRKGVGHMKVWWLTAAGAAAIEQEKPT